MVAIATPFYKIYNPFLASIQDYDLLEQGQDLAERQLEHLLMRAVGESMDMFKNCSQLELSNIDDKEKSFEDDLTLEEINVLVVGMEFFWTQRQLNDTEKMHNVLNTRDFNQYAPQNLLFRLREATADAEDRWDRALRRYAQRHVDIATMGGLIK